MKTLILATTIALAAAGASAHDVYRGLAKGSPDLNDQHPPILGVQPGVGTVTDTYGALADGNPDLFQYRSYKEGHDRPVSRFPDIYQGACSAEVTVTC